jgi:hypothetical protein
VHWLTIISYSWAEFEGTSTQGIRPGELPKAVIAALGVVSGIAFLALIALISLLVRVRSRRVQKQKASMPEIELAPPSARPVVPSISTQVPTITAQAAHSPVFTKSTIQPTSGPRFSSTASPATPLAPTIEQSRTHISRYSMTAPMSPLSYMSPVDEAAPALPQQVRKR